MAEQVHFDRSALQAFHLTYDTAHEDAAFQARGEFLRTFPRRNLRNLTIDQYVIGHRKPTFCTFLEAKTRSWAAIQGASAFKFGIYFGRTKSDGRKIYRSSAKFGNTTRKAFSAVKSALLDLVYQGGRKNFDFLAIDNNPLSQMFKAKILSLYFPDQFINVCSADDLKMLGTALGFAEDRFSSEYQHLLIQAKLGHQTTRTWSNPKFMEFLYHEYGEEEKVAPTKVKRSRIKIHRRVNFEDLQDGRTKIGRIAEEYALAWEKNRLRGAKLEHLIREIDDRRDRPGYGYDFLSYSAPHIPRYIEVKSVAALARNGGYRFFLSDTEDAISRSIEHRSTYYFYLVFFEEGQPANVQSILAKDLYSRAKMLTAVYEVRFT